MSAAVTTRRAAAGMLLALMLLAAPAAPAKGLDGAAKGDGAADDTAALQAALDRGGVLALEPGKTYRISRTLKITKPDSGITGDGTPLILMSSAKGAFDNAAPGGRYGEHAVGILAAGVSGVRIEGLRIMYEGRVEDRYTKAIALRRVTGFRILKNEIWNFSKAEGIIYIGASSGGEIRRNIIRDSFTNSRTRGQITGILFDDDDAGSSGIVVGGNTIARLKVGAAFRSAFDVQTDGINITTRSRNIEVRRNTISEVGEGVDSFGTGIRIVNNRISDCDHFGIKLIHGASDSEVRGNVIDRSGLGGIVLAGSQVVTQDTAGNTIAGNRVTGVNVDRRNDERTTFGIGFMGKPGWTQVRGNRIRNNTVDLGGGGLFGLFADPGSAEGNEARDNSISRWRRAQAKAEPGAFAPGGDAP